MLFVVVFSLLVVGLQDQYLGAQRSPPYPRDFEINQEPVIGIVTMPDEDNPHNTSVVSNYYVQEFERFGARVVPVFHAKPEDELVKLLQQINGVFFTGGSLDLCDSKGNFNSYTLTAQIIWDYARDEFNSGGYFPMWGTCQGFQLFHILASGECEVLINSHSTNHNAKLFYQPQAFNSKLFRHAEKRVLLAAQNEALTYNMHQLGIPLTQYLKYPALGQFFEVLTTSYDQEETLDVSTVEAKDYPFYAVQFHPERPANDQNKDWNINHSIASILFSQELARFFVHESRKNDHRMDQELWEEHLNIWNCKLEYKLEPAMPYYDMGVYFSENFYCSNQQL